MATGLFGLDEAWARTPIADLKAQGVHFMARYLSPDPSKNITASEVRDYAANGIAVVVVWEGSGTAMLGGYAAGVNDAKAAEIQRKAVGLPDNMPIYFACDFDAQGSQYHDVNEYMRGVNDVIGVDRSGFYGGKFTCDNVAASPARASFFWQTIAWSNGLKANKVSIYQDGHTLFGGNADTDYAETADYGQYPRPNGDLVATQAEIDAIAAAVWNHTEINVSNNQATRMGAYVRYSDYLRDQQTKTLTAQIGALTALVQALSKEGGLTAAQAEAAAKAGADAALAELEAALSALKPATAPAGA